jgi:hypothetical protein
MESKMDINPVEDHSERFNIDREKLNEANEAIRNLSKLRKEESGVEVEIVGDKIIHKKSEEDYANIWMAFCINEAKEFNDTMSYGADEIIRIGLKKFIDANDWRTVEDVKKWKTDKADVIICKHCNEEFAHLDITGRLDLHGICSICAPLYDLDRINSVSSFEADKEHYADLKDPAMRFMAARVRVMEQFAFDKEFRDKFLRVILPVIEI